MQMIGLARLGRDAEVRYTADNTTVANMSLAFNYGRKDESGNRPTQWIEAALWGERAGALFDYLKKGTLICVTLDDPHVEEFTKRDGSAGSKLVARIASLEFTGKGGEEKAREPAAKAEPQRQAPKPDARGKAVQSVIDMESDIPF